MIDRTASHTAHNLQLEIPELDAPPQASVSATTISVKPLSLPSSVDAEALDSSFRSWLDAGNPWSQELCLDLSKVTWIDIPALMQIVSVTQQRVDERLSTTLRLPKDRRVRDFLRVWKFQPAFEAAVGKSLVSLVHPDDHNYFGEGQETYQRFGVLTSPLGDMVRTLESRNFFGFLAYSNLSTQFQALMIQDACKRWSDPLILRILNRHLRGPEGDVSRVVVYEALANARQHPDAGTVCLASRFDSRSRNSGMKTDWLTICVWDDGASVLTTLKECLSRGFSIRPTP